MADGIDIKFKRAKTYKRNDYQDVPIKNRILHEGEPFFLMDVDETPTNPKRILLIGDGFSTVEELINKKLYFVVENNTIINIDQLNGFGPSDTSRADLPKENGARNNGESLYWSREDHCHPSDSSKLNKADGVTDVIYSTEEKILKERKNGNLINVLKISDIFANAELTGDPTAPTATPADITLKSNKIANIAYVHNLVDSKSIVETKQPKTSGTIYVTGVEQANGNLFYNTTGTPGTYGVRIDCAKGILKGAAWNDIAEYREGDNIPGKVVCESGDGSVRLSKKRLQRLPYIVSDTFGFAIGETDTCNTPVAIAGRVLAFADNISKIHVGDAVCSSKNGNVSRMNRLEMILFPDRIIGYVTEIPKYFTWNNVQIDNRIWIKIK